MGIATVFEWTMMIIMWRLRRKRRWSRRWWRRRRRRKRIRRGRVCWRPDTEERTNRQMNI